MHNTEDDGENSFIQPPPHVPDTVGVEHERPDGIRVLVRPTLCGDSRYRVMYPDVSPRHIKHSTLVVPMDVRATIDMGMHTYTSDLCDA